MKLIEPKNSRKAVSVIVPMYNVENLIGETISSLKNNKCSMEVILIDDGSTDNTVSQAELAINGDVRFLILKKENSGVSDTRNKGIEVAQGEYVFFCDSDDILADNALDKLYNAAIEMQADYVYGGIKKFNSIKTWSIQVHDKYNLIDKGYKDIIRNHELFFSMGPVAKLMHHSLVKNNFFPKDIHCAEDQVVIFNVLTKAKKIYSIGEYIYFYRERDITENERSITQQRDIKAYEFLQDILSVMRTNYEGIMNNNHYSDNDKKQIIAKYYERALTFDVFPLFIRVLKHQPHNTGKAFFLIQEFIQPLDDDFFNAVPGFRYFFLRNLIDKLYLVDVIYFFNYYSLIKTIFSKLSGRTCLVCEKYWGKKWFENLAFMQKNLVSVFFYFLYLKNKKRIFHYLNTNGETIIKKYIFPIYRLLPIDNHKIIFATSSKGKASSNFTVLLNEIKKDDNSYKVKKFLGYSNSFLRNLSRYYHLATAKNIVLESYYRPLYGIKTRKNTNVIQVWHACGAFKKFGFSAIGGGDANSEDFERLAHGFYTHIVASSDVTGELYREAFDAPQDKIYSLGVPRTDVFFNKSKMIKIKKKLLSEYPNLSNNINVLYAPTFRGSPSERKHFKLPFNFNIIDKLPSNYRLIIKLHPVVDVVNLRKKIPKIYQEKVVLLDSNEDVNEWMIFCDILITDYSSLIFEYALMDKPIIFYAYDIDSYFDERGFYFDYNDYAYGKIVQEEHELINSILSADNNHNLYEKKRLKFIDLFMSSCDGKSASRIVEIFKKGVK